MSKFDFDEFYKSLTQLKSAAAVDEAFKPVLALSADGQKAVGKALEEKFLSSPMKDGVRQYGPRAVKRLVKSYKIYTIAETGKHMPLHKAVPNLQVDNQINSYISTLLGDAASPVAKAYNEAAAKLTAEQKNSPDVVIKPTLAAVDAIAKEEGIAKINPLRGIRNGVRKALRR